MRQFVPCAAAAVVTLAGAARAEDRGRGAAEPLPKTVLVADLGLHVIGAGIQRTVVPWLAAQATVCYYNPWTHNQDLFGLAGVTSDVAGAVLRGRFFVYPFQEAPAGLWISPFGQVGVGATSQTSSGLGSVGALGASVGYSVLIRGTVLAGLGVGAQVHAGYFSRVDRSPTFASVYPHLDANVGFAF